MTRVLLRIAAVAGAVTLLGGCYGAKMIKSPINTEYTAEQVDSVRVQQDRILRELALLRSQLAEERNARLQSQAQTNSTLGELDESVRILISRINESGERPTEGATPRSYARPGVPSRPSTTPPDTGAVADSSASAAGGPARAEELYRDAYLDLTRGDYALATQGFQNYLVRFPSGAKIPEVHYYLGECYYAQDRYLEAVADFQYVVREFPDSRLAPAAYLKSGFCYRFLEERHLAQKAFETLIERYPGTDEAKQARAALAEMKG